MLSDSSDHAAEIKVIQKEVKEIIMETTHLYNVAKFLTSSLSFPSPNFTSKDSTLFSSLLFLKANDSL